MKSIAPDKTEGMDGTEGLIPRDGDTVKGGEPAVSARRGVIRVRYIYSGPDSERLLDTLECPANKDAVAGLLKRAGLDGVNERVFFIDGIETVIPALDDVIPDAADIDEMNYLSAKIAGMNEGERELFAAVIAEDRYCGSLGEIINLTENLGCFELQAVTTPGEYGEFLLGVRRKDFAAALSRIEWSGDPSDRALAKFIRLMEDLVDFERHGRANLRDGEEFTPFNRLTENEEGYTAVYRGPEDIPAEYRVTPAWTSAPLVAVKGADLAVLLAEMHAAGGDGCHQDLPHSLRQLTDGSADYFVMLSPGMLHVIPAETLYHRDITGNEIVLGLEPSPEIRAYHVSVTGRDGGQITGNLYEVDLTAVQDSLRQYSFDFSHIEAEMRDGSRREISFAEWGEKDPRERGEIRSCAFHYPPEDEARLRGHIANLRAAYEDTRAPISAAGFIENINAPYLAGAKHPRPDMLRVSLPAAKEMLTRGDAAVYRLLPEGPVELSALDALPGRGGLWYQEYREFAIRKADFPGLEKWAEREVEAICRPQPERGEKPKPREPER